MNKKISLLKEIHLYLYITILVLNNELFIDELNNTLFPNIKDSILCEEIIFNIKILKMCLNKGYLVKFSLVLNSLELELFDKRCTETPEVREKFVKLKKNKEYIEIIKRMKSIYIKTKHLYSNKTKFNTIVKRINNIPHTDLDSYLDILLLVKKNIKF